MEDYSPKTSTPMVDKKELPFPLPCRGHPACDFLQCRLNSAIARTYPAAGIRLIFSGTPLLRLEGKDKLPFQTSSMRIYAGYIGRTTRRLSKQMQEHHPVWLYQGEQKSISSAIATHLVDTGHQVDVNQALLVIYEVPARHSKPLRQRILATAEAMDIQLTNLALCPQKAIIKALLLPRSKMSHESPDPHRSTSRHSDET
ncbi:hypothetical protein SprV_0602129400 [Sparganum proliferum]